MYIYIFFFHVYLYGHYGYIVDYCVGSMYVLIYIYIEPQCTRGLHPSSLVSLGG